MSELCANLHRNRHSFRGGNPLFFNVIKGD
jgi:hypothetical protein